MTRLSIGGSAAFVLAALLSARPAAARHDASCDMIAVHTASAGGADMRWETRILPGCRHIGDEESRFVLLYPLPLGTEIAVPGDLVGTEVEQGRIVALVIRWPAPEQTTSRIVFTMPSGSKLSPPLFADTAQIVSFADPSASFEPRVASRHTPYGVVIADRSGEWHSVTRRARQAGLRVSATSLLVHPDPRIARSEGIEGTLGRRNGSAFTLVIAAGAVGTAALAALLIAFRRLARRVRLEQAEAIVRADLGRL